MSRAGAEAAGEGAPDTHSCSECRGPLAGGQRYCLQCGARHGPPSRHLRRLRGEDVAVGGVGAGGAVRTAGASGARGGARGARASAAGPHKNAANAARRRDWWRELPVRIPSRPVSAVLIAGFLGFGVLLGSVAANRTQDTLAATGAPLRLVVPAHAGGSGASGAASGPAGESRPPASEPEATPEPSSVPSPAASKSSGGKAGSGGSSESGAGTGSGESGSGTGGSGETGAGGGSSSEGGAATKVPKFGHVFVVMLSNEPYASAFGPASIARYLVKTLEPRGELLVRYDAIAHEQLANEIALVSGQGPTPQIAANCPLYADIAPAAPVAPGQVTGSGCAFPASVQTLAGQLAAKHKVWHAYIEGLPGAGATGGACPLPAAGAPDPTALPGASGAWATWRDPFLYFHSVTGSSTCTSGDVPIGRLRSDLASIARTPSFSYIAADRCHDGDPAPCSPGAPAGMGPADSFLAHVVPQILASPAYKRDGLLVITGDEAPSSGELADSSSCCGQPSFPNMPPGPTGSSPRGGGAVGALLLSPHVKGGTTSQEPFNHFSLLRSIEDAFGLAHLGYAGLAAVKPLPASLFTSG